MSEQLTEGYHEALPLEALRPAEDNPRRIAPEALEALKGSLAAAPEMLEARPIIAVPDGRIVAGEMRWRALSEMGEEAAPAFIKALDDRARREWMLRDNNGFGTWIDEDLGGMIASLQSEGTDALLLGFNPGDVDALLAGLAEGNGAGEPRAPTLADRFLVPPFTTLDSRQGYWRARDKQWLSLGIRSEEGRGENLLQMSETVRRGGKAAPATEGYSASGWDPKFYEKKAAAEARLGRELSAEEFEREHYEGSDGGDIANTGTSVFSPTLCEIVYRWFSPPEGRVLDPFAGGSVRGIVAALLRRRYVGIELSGRQVEANHKQAEEMVARGDPDNPEWIQGDALSALHGVEEESADLIFSCPPYFNLERYSDDPRDLSAMEPDNFRGAYGAIIELSIERLRPDRFACFVVGDHRQGHRQLSLVSETISAFERAGAMFYNEAILIAPVGSAAIRAARSFAVRKLTRTHQHVLVFCKGDPVEAVKACGPVEIDSEAFNEAG